MGRRTTLSEPDSKAMNQTSVSVIHAQFSALKSAQESAFMSAMQTVQAASALGESLEQFSAQDLPGIVAQVEGLKIEAARNCIRVHRKVKENEGKELDPGTAKQLLVWTELVPAPEPRNPEPGQPSKVIDWAVKLESKIPRLLPDERAQLRDVLVRLVARLS